jgi:uncharacterized protein with FMN-binding domain
MKKLIVSALIVGVFLVYTLSQLRGLSAVAQTPLPTTGTSTDTSATPSGGGTPGTTTSTGYKDGSYTGPVTDAQWGYVQVKVIIQGGKVTDVQWLQYPNERDRSVFINQYADPQLTQEAIQAQSSQVDIISGATDSSLAFMQSLSVALQQAQA